MLTTPLFNSPRIRSLEKGSQVLGMLRAVGVDGETLRTGQTIIKSASGVNNVVKAAMKGDIFATVGAAFGLLFGGGRDIEAERHKEIMDELAEIKNTQRQIFQNLIEIENKVDRLTDLVVEQHREVMEKLDSIERVVTSIQEVQYENSHKELRALRTTLDKVANAEKLEDKLRILDVAPNTRSFRNGHERLVNLVNQKGFGGKDFSVLFFLRSSPELKNDRVKQYYDWATRHYELANSLIKNGDRDSTYNALTAPSLTVSRLGDYKKASDPELVQEILNPKTVAEFGMLVTDALPFVLRLAPESSKHLFLANKDLLDKENQKHILLQKRETLTQIMYPTLRLLNSAIAQQAILGGDQVLPVLATKTGDEAVRAILKENTRLRENLGVYLAKQSRTTEFAYSVFYQFEDRFHLEAVSKAKDRAILKIDGLGDG